MAIKKKKSSDLWRLIENILDSCKSMENPPQSDTSPFLPPKKNIKKFLPTFREINSIWYAFQFYLCAFLFLLKLIFILFRMFYKVKFMCSLCRWKKIDSLSWDDFLREKIYSAKIPFFCKPLIR